MLALKKTTADYLDLDCYVICATSIQKYYQFGKHVFLCSCTTVVYLDLDCLFLCSCTTVVYLDLDCFCAHVPQWFILIYTDFVLMYHSGLS